LQITLTDTHPPEALQLLRASTLDDPLYLLSTRRVRNLATLHDATWIAGCERCRSHLLSLCADEGFEPLIGYTSDDMVVMQALVVAGLAFTTIPGLALRTHRAEGIVARELPGSRRHVYAATYGEPPDPPATAALLAALGEAAGLSRRSVSPARTMRRSLSVLRGCVRDADNRALIRKQPRDRLPPRLLARLMQERKPRLPQLIGGGGNGSRILYLELDAHLRHRPVGRPLVGAEARLRRLGQRPDAEMLTAPDPLAVEVLTAGVGLERKPQRVDVQLVTLRRVGRDHGNARDPFDVHSRQLTANARAHERITTE
jgi:hypothetical protein